MRYNGIRVYTEIGFSVYFYEVDGKAKARCQTRLGNVYELDVLKSTVSELKVGKYLQFCYYVACCAEEFISSTPIVSFESV